MPKSKSSHVKQLNNWVKETKHPEHFSVKDNMFIVCEPCQKPFIVKKLFNLKQHELTSIHQEHVQRFTKKPEYQLLLSDVDPKENEFFVEMASAFVSANIPFYKLQNPTLRNFLTKYTNKTIPNESTLRKGYLKKMYCKSLDSIRRDIGESMVWVAVDESTDTTGRHIANFIVGRLNKDTYSRSHLLASKALDATNAATITRFVVDCLGILWPGCTQEKINNRFLLFLSDGVAYMKCAGNNLKGMYSNLIHVTCIVHGLHRVAEDIRSHYPDVDQLISSVKAVFRKAPSRISKYKSMFPELELPPKVVLTRWGTWLHSVQFFATHYDSVKAVVDSFDSRDALCITKAQEMFNKHGIIQNLAYISSHFTFLCEKIKMFEKKDLRLSQAMEMISECTEKLNQAQGTIGKSVLKKWTTVLAKNKDIKILLKINKILTGDTDVSTHLKPYQVSAFKYALVTTVDAERSFSIENLIFSSRRQSMTAEHLEWYIVSNIELAEL